MDEEEHTERLLPNMRDFLSVTYKEAKAVAEIQEVKKEAQEVYANLSRTKILLRRRLKMLKD